MGEKRTPTAVAVKGLRRFERKLERRASCTAFFVTIKSENRGTLILDATCCPADIHYPTDAGLLNHARELVEKMIDLLYPAARDLYPEKPRTYSQQARERYLAYIKKRTHTVRETRMVLRGNLQYIQRDIGYIEKMVAHGVSLSLLGNDLYRKLLVIQELCRQQWDMYVRKSHQIEDRIVSIDQPHVRPIVRGKAGCPTEFGAKVIVGLVSGYAFLMKADWNNYSESRSLKQVVEEYKETFGFYPKTILADRAYPGRENRLWCTSLVQVPGWDGSRQRRSRRKANRSTRMAATAS